jgi:hypothetical protein
MILSFSHAFVSFPDDASAAAAVKQGATFKDNQLRVAFQTKRAEPQKRSLDLNESSGNETSTNGRSLIKNTYFVLSSNRS